MAPKIVPTARLGFSPYDAAWRDWKLTYSQRCNYGLSSTSRGDGVLTIDELRACIDQQLQERAKLYADNVREGFSNFYSRDTLDMKDSFLKDSREMLREMQEKNIDGVAYLPEEVAEFPTYLRCRITEMLMADWRVSYGEVTQLVLDNARSRYMTMPGSTKSERENKQRALEEVSEIAQRLGLY
jgi:hypothetical protein